jgi:hypothetical protein
MAGPEQEQNAETFQLVIISAGRASVKDNEVEGGEGCKKTGRIIEHRTPDMRLHLYGSRCITSPRAIGDKSLGYRTSWKIDQWKTGLDYVPEMIQITILFQQRLPPGKL